MAPIRAYRGNLTPPEAPCWWFFNWCANGQLYYYTINGLPWLTNAQTVFNGLGMNYYYYGFTIIPGIGSVQDAFFYSFYGTSDQLPAFTALDDNGNPFTSWVKLSDFTGSCSTKTCWQKALKDGSTAVIKHFDLWNGHITIIDFQNWIGSLNLMTVPGQIAFKNAIVNCYGTGADVTFSTSIDEVLVTITNIWSDQAPIVEDNGGDITTFDKIDCP